MIKYLKEYRFYIILFLFVLIPIIAIDTASRAPRDYRFYDRVIVGLTSPIQTLISATLDGIVSVTQNYLFLFHTRRENRELLDENRRLLTTIVQLKEAEQENLRLRKLLNFQEFLNLKTVAARVIAKDVSTEYRAIRINQGERAGIKANMAVLTSEGIVGRVLRTTETTADVLTVLDLLSGVDGVIERSRVRGVVEGMTDELCQMKYVLRTDDVQKGDLIVTSGIGGIFPKGVPVGTVSDFDPRTWGVSKKVEVVPSVDFSKLEEVLVMVSEPSAPMHVERAGP